MLLIYQSSQFDPTALSKEEHQAIATEYGALNATPDAMPGLPLGHLKDVVTVRVKDGATVATEGRTSNIAAPIVVGASAFYGDILGISIVMDMVWILTFANPDQNGAQISVATEGGTGSPVPDISIEVDDFDDVLHRVRDRGSEVVYGPQTEPWGRWSILRARYVRATRENS